MSEILPLGEFVTVRRRGLDERLSGVALAVGKKWAALAIEFDLGYDGITFLRLRDVQKVGPMRHPEVLRAIWERQGWWPPGAVDLPLDRTRDLLKELGARRSVVEVHYEYDDPDAMLVGVPVAGFSDGFDLLTLDPDAEWDSEPTEMTFKEVSRIELGSVYVERLLSVSEPVPRARVRGS